jgi:hypothetical protein
MLALASLRTHREGNSPERPSNAIAWSSRSRDARTSLVVNPKRGQFALDSIHRYCICRSFDYAQDFACVLPLRFSSLRQYRCVQLAAALVICLFTGSAGAQRTVSAPAAAHDQTCSLPGLTPDLRRTPTTDDLLRAYNAQAALVHSVRGSLILHSQDESEPGGQKKNSRPFPAMLSFKSPAFVRMTGVIPFAGRRSFDLASDGRQFRLLVPEGKAMRLFVGPADALQTSSDAKENIRPRMVLEAVSWLPARLKPQANSTPAMRDGMETMDVELTTSTRSLVPAQLEFDLRTGTLARITIPDADTKSSTSVDYSDWQSARGAGAGDRTACFPRRILFTQPEQARSLEMKFMSVEVNVAIPLAQFQFVPPPGVPITRLGPAAGSARH